MNAERLAKTKNEIVTDIKFYISEQGSRRYREWYVGVSKDAKDRMFNQHKVDEKKDLWIYRQADSSATAREVEEHLVNMLGFDGAATVTEDGGVDSATSVAVADETADMVYAFKKSGHTEPKEGEDGE